MKNSARLLKGLRIAVHRPEIALYEPLTLDAVTPAQLPNNAFDQQKLYAIRRSKFGHWPVYKKVQNTKITTEIKRVDGNVRLFASELQALMGGSRTAKDIRVNGLTGEVNIKGDHVAKIKGLLDTHLGGRQSEPSGERG
ncbi:hypothetical protein METBISCDRAFT_26866 [Metschnikowia bicuspidata]|uniref:Large ribosomal subunit protein mL49 n=1 Tax=Metschnikowia bicuspidata TaxID=27322 RepID=A0A4P9ZDV9_9ASCO|nr:hypothetical protein METBISCDRAFT_25125 [Metschnikowia bicuspidata]RKP31157.1 hypothetical protein METBISCDRAFT_26866 [Metschnikowia bicuspidata]